MYNLMNRLGSGTLLRVRGTLPEAFLNSCARKNIHILSAERGDDFTVTAYVSSGRTEQLKKIAAGCGCEIEVLGESGRKKVRKTVLGRIVPLVLIALTLLVLMWSRLYIWEIEIDGNEKVSSSEIIAALEECGVKYGTFWPALTSDNIRSEVLVRLPELSWISVNIHGSSARVLVRERVEKPEIIEEKEPADVIADKTGAIMDVEVFIGAPVVKRGNAVAEGELLISGALDSISSPPRFVHAWGKLEAQTYYELSAVAPVEELQKSYTGKRKDRWSLEVGGKRLNFYRNSSIYDESCDKIISVWDLAAEGLFALPVELRRESCLFYEIGSHETDMNLLVRQMEELLHDRLAQLLDEGGEILSEKYSANSDGSRLFVCLRAVCSEDIGRSVPISAERIAEIQNKFITKGEEADD